MSAVVGGINIGIKTGLMPPADLRPVQFLSLTDSYKVAPPPPYDPSGEKLLAVNQYAGRYMKELYCLNPSILKKLQSTFCFHIRFSKIWDSVINNDLEELFTIRVNLSTLAFGLFLSKTKQLFLVVNDTQWLVKTYTTNLNSTLLSFRKEPGRLTIYENGLLVFTGNYSGNLFPGNPTWSILTTGSGLLANLYRIIFTKPMPDSDFTQFMTTI